MKACEGSDDASYARRCALGFAATDSDEHDFALFERAAVSNDPDVLCALGRCYCYGWGVSLDVQRGLKCFSKAADAGCAYAMWELYFASGFSPAESVNAVVQSFLENQQTGTAVFNAAFCYYQGLGTAQDDSRAAELFAMSADQRNAEAAAFLGACYEQGRGVEQDYVSMLKQYQRAASADSATGCVWMAECYSRGIGVQKDQNKATALLETAARLGDAEAAFKLASRCVRGMGTPKNAKIAVGYFTQAARAGNEYAQVELAQRLWRGRDCDKNQREAARWYLKAASRGHEGARKMLAQCCKSDNALPSGQAEREVFCAKAKQCFRVDQIGATKVYI